MRPHLLSLTLPLLLAPAVTGAAPSCDRIGSLVGVSIVVEGRRLPLFQAPRRDGRSYFEARLGAAYEIHLHNQTGERVAVALSVDGLNVISGTPGGDTSRGPGRMYVLAPWGSSVVRGWRRSLASVQLFSFVDEQDSYVIRSGQPGERLGSIDVAVYRERTDLELPILGRPSGRGAPAPQASADEAAPAARAAEKSARAEASGFPGTGWGRDSEDHAVLVHFEPEAVPAETLRLRYEYAWALRRLGIRLQAPGVPGRLWERERVDEGFARPPRPR